MEDDNKKELTEKQKLFAREYILDWNGTRAYKAVYPDVNTDESAKAAASRLLTNVNLQSYIKEIQQDLEKQAGISRLSIALELKKIAFSSIAHLHNTWIERKDFESLTDDQKACISEITTQVRKKTETEFDASEGEFVQVPVEVEFVKIKLYDKQKAIEGLRKMLGYDAPDKIQHSGNIHVSVSKEEAREISKSLDDEY